MAVYSYSVDLSRKSLLTFGDILDLSTAKTEEERGIIGARLALKMFATKDGEFMTEQQIMHIPFCEIEKILLDISNEIQLAELLSEVNVSGKAVEENEQQ